MSTARIVAAAWMVWAVWQGEKDDRSGTGHQAVWDALMEMFHIMDEVGR